VARLTTVVALVVAGIVVPSSPAVAAEPWSCLVDTFENRRGAALHSVSTETGAFGASVTFSGVYAAGNDLNSLGMHPITREVWGTLTNVAGVPAVNVNQDGTVEATGIPDLQPQINNDAAPDQAFFAGGDFDAEGNWLLASGQGSTATVDLTDPASATYGQVISQGFTNVAWLSGDLAYREADDRVYFATWNTPAETTPRFGWISRADFIAGANPTTPTFGAPIVLPAGVTGIVGWKLGFDSNGDLWASTNTFVPAGGEPVWRFDGDLLAGTEPLAPEFIVEGNVPNTGSGSDGFMCRADVELPTTPNPTDPEAAPEPQLAQTGPESAALVGGVGAALVAAGLALFWVRRRSTQRTSIMSGPSSV